MTSVPTASTAAETPVLPAPPIEPQPSADPQPAPPEPDRFAKVPGLIKLYQTEGPMDLDERCGDYEVRTRLI